MKLFHSLKQIFKELLENYSEYLNIAIVTGNVIGIKEKTALSDLRISLKWPKTV